MHRIARDESNTPSLTLFNSPGVPDGCLRLSVEDCVALVNHAKLVPTPAPRTEEAPANPTREPLTLEHVAGNLMRIQLPATNAAGQPLPGKTWALFSEPAMELAKVILADPAKFAIPSNTQPFSDEIKRAGKLVKETFDIWLKANLGIAWEGGIDAAMEAAVREIKKLTKELAENLEMTQAALRSSRTHREQRDEALAKLKAPTFNVEDPTLEQMVITALSAHPGIQAQTEQVMGVFGRVLHKIQVERDEAIRSSRTHRDQRVEMRDKRDEVMACNDRALAEIARLQGELQKVNAGMIGHLKLDGQGHDINGLRHRLVEAERKISRMEHDGVVGGVDVVAMAVAERDKARSENKDRMKALETANQSLIKQLVDAQEERNKLAEKLRCEQIIMQDKVRSLTADKEAFKQDYEAEYALRKKHGHRVQQMRLELTNIVETLTQGPLAHGLQKIIDGDTPEPKMVNGFAVGQVWAAVRRCDNTPVEVRILAITMTTMVGLVNGVHVTDSAYHWSISGKYHGEDEEFSDLIKLVKRG